VAVFKLSGVKGQGQPIREYKHGPIKHVYIVFGVDL